LRLPIDVIKILIEYCAEGDHKNLSYISKVAMDWAMSGIDSEQKAREKICDCDKFLREIKKVLAVSNLNASQKKLINDWRSNLPDEVILAACDITVLNIGKPNFKYISSILKQCEEKNIKTSQEAYALSDKNKDLKSKSKKKAIKFTNFEQRKWDYEAIERRAQED